MSYGQYKQLTKISAFDATENAQIGMSIAISGDGTTIAVGGSGDNGGLGAVWIFRKVNNQWKQEAKLYPTEYSPTGTNKPYFGNAVAINQDGSQVFIGGYQNANGVGANWAFSYDAETTTWAKLGSYVGLGRLYYPQQGYSVAMTPDGNTAITGGPSDDIYNGAIWIYVRVTNVWIQQVAKIASPTSYIYFGESVAINADASIAVIGTRANAVYVYAQINTKWTYQQTLSVATPLYFGRSVAINAQGNVALISDAGANVAWCFTHTGNTWKQIGKHLVPQDATTTTSLGAVVSMNAAGNIFAVSGRNDNNNVGAVLLYSFNGTAVVPMQSKVFSNSYTSAPYEGTSVSLDAIGETLVFGGFGDLNNVGAGWIYSNAAITSSPSFAPTTPTMSPSNSPTVVPTILPSTTPTVTPSQVPTAQPTVGPTAAPTGVPSQTPTTVPTILPSTLPTMEPTLFPTFLPTGVPNLNPTIVPSRVPTNQPSIKPSLAPIALTGAATTSSLDMLSIVIIAVIGGLALICTLLLIRYRLSRNYREADTAIGEMNEWIEDAKTNANHGSYIQLQHSSKQAKAEDPLLTDVYADNKGSGEML